MQSAAEAGAGEVADEGEEEDADADETKYALGSCHCTALMKVTSGCVPGRLPGGATYS